MFLQAARVLFCFKGTRKTVGFPSGFPRKPTKRRVTLSKKADYGPGFPGVVAALNPGGVDIRAQRDTLRRGVHWCAGTPGRLLDLLTRRWLSLNDLAVLVLDEADRTWVRIADGCGLFATF